MCSVMLSLSIGTPYAMHVAEVRQQPERITCARFTPWTPSCDRQCNAHTHTSEMHAICFVFLYHFRMSVVSRQLKLVIHLLGVGNADPTKDYKTLSLRQFDVATCVCLSNHFDGEQLIKFSGRQIRAIMSVYSTANVLRRVTNEPTKRNQFKSHTFWMCKDASAHWRRDAGIRNEKSYHQIHLFKCKRQFHFHLSVSLSFPFVFFRAPQRQMGKCGKKI